MPHVTLHEHNDELAEAEASSSSTPWYGKFLRCALQRQKKSCSIRSSPRADMAGRRRCLRMLGFPGALSRNERAHFP